MKLKICDNEFLNDYFRFMYDLDKESADLLIILLNEQYSDEIIDETLKFEVYGFSSIYEFLEFYEICDNEKSELEKTFDLDHLDENELCTIVKYFLNEEIEILKDRSNFIIFKKI